MKGQFCAQNWHRCRTDDTTYTPRGWERVHYSQEETLGRVPKQVWNGSGEERECALVFIRVRGGSRLRVPAQPGV